MNAAESSPRSAPTREQVTQWILAAKRRKRLRWRDVAAQLGASKEWATAACLGQMTLTPEQAETAGKLFDLPAEAVELLQVVPYKGAANAVPHDPLIYRFHELVSVYGSALKELIHEEFGDGIMSAIDFAMDVQRLPDPRGDRVQITMHGKFLPYRSY